MKKSITPAVESAQKTVELVPTVLEQIKKISEELKKQQSVVQHINSTLELVLVTVLSQAGYDISTLTNLSIDDEKSVLLFEVKEA